MAEKQGGGGRISIRDVAAAANVSITTVSHALSGKGRINEETRRRVRRIAEEIGYQPSLSARGLVTGRSHLLAIQASGFEDKPMLPQLDYFVDILNAASAAAVEKGFALVLVPPGGGEDEVRRLQVDGAAIVDPVGDEALLRAMRREGKPVVTSDRLEGEPGIRHVETDYEAGARAMLGHLYENGARRISLLTTGAGPSYVADVVAAYRRWCVEKGLPRSVARVRGKPSEQNGLSATRRLLEGDRRPDAVFASLDSLAIGALKAANQLGLSIPEQFKVGALTDAAILRAAVPPVTGLDLHPDVVGQRLVEMLVNEIENPEEPIEFEPVVPDLLPRASTSSGVN